MGRKEVGDAGEQRAAEWLQKKGYRLVQRNARFPGGEIDLICEHEGDLVFIEVKTRLHPSVFGDPAETISSQKIRRLLRAGYAYLRSVKEPDKPFRLEAVLVEGQGEFERVTHLVSLDAGVDAW